MGAEGLVAPVLVDRVLPESAPFRLSEIDPGPLRSPAGARAHLLEVDPELRCDDEVLGRDGPLGEPIEVLGRTVANRFWASRTSAR